MGIRGTASVRIINRGGAKKAVAAAPEPTVVPHAPEFDGTATMALFPKRLQYLEIAKQPKTIFNAEWDKKLSCWPRVLRNLAEHNLPEIETKHSEYQNYRRWCFKDALPGVSLLIRRSPARGDGDVDEHGNKIVSYAIWFRADENLPGINLRKRELVSVNYDLDRPGGSYHCFYAGTGKFALQFLEDVIAADGFVHLGDSTPGEKK